MKILHVISSMDPRQGGTSEAVRQLGLEAIRTGHEVRVATIDDPAGDWLRDFPLPIEPLGPGRTSYQYSGKFQHWLDGHVAQYDAVIAHALWQFTGVAVRRACKNKRPYFVFPHGMLDPWFNQFPLKRLKKSLIWPWADHRVLRDARAVFFTSEEERLGARRAFSPYAANEVITPLGIEEPPPWNEAMGAAFLDKVPQVRGQDFLLFFGRIHPKKGCDLLLRAYAETGELRPLVMAGPDQTGRVPELQKLAATLGIAGRVFWPGMLTGEAKWGALTLAAAFVLPSHQENFGLAVAEALACGTPVLISNKVNIWREVVAAGGGHAADDTVDGTRELLTLSRTQPVTREKARRCFEENFRLSTAANLLHQRIAELIA